MGRRQALQRLDVLRTEQRAMGVAGFLDLSDCALFPWKLWFSNLGRSCATILGVGIRRVMLSIDDGPGILLVLTRADDSEVELVLTHTDDTGTRFEFRERS